MFESMCIFEFGVVDIAANKDCTMFVQKMKASNNEIQAAVESNDLLGMVEANHLFHINFAKCSQNEFLIRAVYDVRSEAKRLSLWSGANTMLRPCRLLTNHILTFRERIILFMVS